MNFAALIAGLSTGIMASMGMGGGAVLLIYLTVFKNTPQLAAQGINLLFFIPIGLLSVIIYWKRGEIKFKKIWPFAALGLAGALIGIYLTTLFKGEILAKVFGAFLILVGGFEIFGKARK